MKTICIFDIKDSSKSLRTSEKETEIKSLLYCTSFTGNTRKKHVGFYLKTFILLFMFVSQSQSLYGIKVLLKINKGTESFFFLFLNNSISDCKVKI